ncbi:MAG: hypothetical protein IPK72_25875 [Candidatus Eisenbacteria bacterium]|nr:hypothetical protein [Candidatus Eisenbacteria bacterium]
MYSGTMEQTSFSEKDPGNVAVVDIARAGDKPIVSKHHVGALHWTEHGPTIRDATDAEHLRKAILDAGPLAAQLLRITHQLDEAVPADVLGELRSVRDELQEEALFLDWPQETLDAALDALVILPEGLVAEVDEDFGAILEGRIPEGPARAAAAEPPEVVKEARALLRRLVTEVQR